MDIKKILLGPASCSLDLGDGSERGEYVSQEYILNRLGRPHRAISLMYCYYPLDKGWPLRARDAFPDIKVSGSWDYPYDDYFPYLGGIGGSKNAEPFRSMREIREYGQDIILTLTMDPHLPDSYLKAVAEDLKPFGRLYLRVNHEATGNWFEFTKRASYQEIADFYTRFSKILKETAPNVITVLSAGGIKEPENTHVEMESEFSEAIITTDVWSLDQYLSLHWGWPNDTAETNCGSYLRKDENAILDYLEKSYMRFCEINSGISKPMIVSEINADGDVDGPYGQAETVQKFYDLILEKRPEWLSGICMYQFRDRGRLGLETESSSDENTGIPVPLLDTYKKIIKNEYFCPVISESSEKTSLPLKIRWTSSEDAEGLKIKSDLLSEPVFMEILFNENDNNNYMLLFNGRWFHRSPSVRCIDLMPSFFENPFSNVNEYSISVFSPPSGGENDLSEENGIYDSYTQIDYIPELRIRYKPV